jgi:hypothetical protein
MNCNHNNDLHYIMSRQYQNIISFVEPFGFSLLTDKEEYCKRLIMYYELGIIKFIMVNIIKKGGVRESNSLPLVPKTRIIPIDQRPFMYHGWFRYV